jgi:benzoyl-CoA reductase/2-hydroxyglutaryl-CoA dehydratase subunit BcrC/BadD/HgdB
MVSEMRDLIALLENRTGRKFDEARLHHLMERINEQEGYIWEAAQAIGRARPCPVSIAEQMPNTMIPQWHRGSDWAVDHARRFRDEVMERIASGAGTAAHEKIRLMWIGAGVWHDPGFYQALEERLGPCSSGPCTCRSPGRSISASCTDARWMPWPAVSAR